MWYIQTNRACLDLTFKQKTKKKNCLDSIFRLHNQTLWSSDLNNKTNAPLNYLLTFTMVNFILTMTYIKFSMMMVSFILTISYIEILSVMRKKMASKLCPKTASKTFYALHYITNDWGGVLEERREI